MKRFLRILRTTLITLLTFLFLYAVLIVIARYQAGIGGYDYQLFDDGRFVIVQHGEDGRLFLTDTKPVGSDTLVARVERYYEKGDLVYVTGYHSDTGVNADAPRFPSFANLIDQEKRIKYYSIEEIPRYIILNVKTAEMQLYRTLDEVPEDQQGYFTKDLNWWCDIMKTCYEKK